MDTETKSLFLRVSEALTKDVGRGIARLDPQDMEKADISIGDVIEIKGNKKTVAKVMPAYQEHRGKNIIQIDGIIRENAQIGLGDKVQIKKIPFKTASTIILAPITGFRTDSRDKDSRYIGKLMEGFPLLEGNKVRVNLFGSRPQEFVVVETIPKGVVMVHAGTIVKVRPEEGSIKKQSLVTYEDIGGLHKEIQRIREMIELPLKYPEIFARLGIEAPKGVLLHGPPGTGKTLIARAVANETDAHFIHVNGPEIIHKFYGESEAKLRGIFEEAARNAPSIIFLDEIDAIAPKREAVVGEVEKRVVAQLLGLMDGLESRGQVIVIGATNIPNSLDPALRRPGRFDREITINIPDKNSRLEILQIHTRGMPLAKDVNLEKIAEITHGYVGADLAALCKEAAMACLRKMFPKIDFQDNYLPYEVLAELEVTMADFAEAFREIEPSAIREVVVEVPDVRWSDVGGLDKVKQELKEAVEWPLKYPGLFTYAKTEPPKGILLYGSPGTGKTLIAKAVANESGVNFISVKGPALLSKWVGESEKGVREVFKKAKQAAPCIIFFDEIDALVPVRGTGSGDAHVAERVLSQLLTEMDGVEELKGVVVLAATNRLELIDPALLRPGRFDLLLELPVPDEDERLEIFRIHTSGKPLAADVDLVNLAIITDGATGADIKAICNRASLLAIREFVEDYQNEMTDYSLFQIRAKHFSMALEEVIRPEPDQVENQKTRVLTMKKEPG
ncbi:CDC48 family AAA ATPase [Desulfofundulus sp. TPOSR]|uniref:CDC48 family AAA ATPase n=1 Tax=Desulfofundulus sp. TPOSR TaxID=2714340 RepID=UPI0014079C43|nr:CDC48 family AAA ATPase [Desulfofundulus sp. TPOSR]NHM26764.1 CDC48 family AAA ATPase [Desulfofundulus sp. TPOSR]